LEDELSPQILAAMDALRKDPRRLDLLHRLVIACHKEGVKPPDGDFLWEGFTAYWHGCFELLALLDIAQSHLVDVTGLHLQLPDGRCVEQLLVNGTYRLGIQTFPPHGGALRPERS
jgi:hypothetical protein